LRVVVNNDSPTDTWFDDMRITFSGIEVVEENHFYPYGLQQEETSYTVDGITPYRHGFQGQFAEREKETSLNNFDLRMYSADIGRWMAPDPYGQFSSPYVGMGNDPANSVDPDGGWIAEVGKWSIDGTRYMVAGTSGLSSASRIISGAVGIGKGLYASLGGGDPPKYKSPNVEYAKKIQTLEQVKATLPASGAVHSNFDDLGEILAYELAGGVAGKVVGLGVHGGRYLRVANNIGKKLFKFSGDEAVIHFGKHANQIMKITGKTSYNLKNYVDDANWIIQNGTYSSKLNGYYHYMGNATKGGESLFGFVGMKNGGSAISTFHIKSATQLGLK